MFLLIIKNYVREQKYDYSQIEESFKSPFMYIWLFDNFFMASRVSKRKRAYRFSTPKFAF